MNIQKDKLVALLQGVRYVYPARNCQSFKMEVRDTEMDLKGFKTYTIDEKNIVNEEHLKQIAAQARYEGVFVMGEPGIGKTTKFPIAISTHILGVIAVVLPTTLQASAAFSSVTLLGHTAGLVVDATSYVGSASGVVYVGAADFLKMYVKRSSFFSNLSCVIFDECHSEVSEMKTAMRLFHKIRANKKKASQALICMSATPQDLKLQFKSLPEVQYHSVRVPSADDIVNGVAPDGPWLNVTEPTMFITASLDDFQKLYEFYKRKCVLVHKISHYMTMTELAAIYKSSESKTMYLVEPGCECGLTLPIKILIDAGSYELCEINRDTFESNVLVEHVSLGTFIQRYRRLGRIHKAGHYYGLPVNSFVQKEEVRDDMAAKIHIWEKYVCMKSTEQWPVMNDIQEHILFFLLLSEFTFLQLLQNMHEDGFSKDFVEKERLSEIPVTKGKPKLIRDEGITSDSDTSIETKFEASLDIVKIQEQTIQTSFQLNSYKEEAEDYADSLVNKLVKLQHQVEQVKDMKDPSLWFVVPKDQELCTKKWSDYSSEEKKLLDDYLAGDVSALLDPDKRMFLAHLWLKVRNRCVLGLRKTMIDNDIQMAKTYAKQYKQAVKMYRTLNICQELKYVSLNNPCLIHTTVILHSSMQEEVNIYLNIEQDYRTYYAVMSWNLDPYIVDLKDSVGDRVAYGVLVGGKLWFPNHGEHVAAYTNDGTYICMTSVAGNEYIKSVDVILDTYNYAAPIAVHDTYYAMFRRKSTGHFSRFSTVYKSQVLYTADLTGKASDSGLPIISSFGRVSGMYLGKSNDFGSALITEIPTT